MFSYFRELRETLTYVPGVKIADDENNGRKLVPIG